jgi:hypothetical protein
LVRIIPRSQPSSTNGRYEKIRKNPKEDIANLRHALRS